MVILLPVPRDDFKYTEESADHLNTSHQGTGVRHLCPLHLGIRVARKNTTQSSVEWNNVILTEETE